MAYRSGAGLHHRRKSERPSHVSVSSTLEYLVMIPRIGLRLAALAVGVAAVSLTAVAADYAASSTAPGTREPVAVRLNGTQYRQIIADVFGPTIEIGGRFEPGLRK